MTAATKGTDIYKKMTLGKPTVKNLEDIEENNKRVKVVGKLTNLTMAEILVMYENTVLV